MGNKQKAVLLFFDGESVSYVRFPRFFPNFEIVGASAPAGFGISGCDAGTVDGGPPVGIAVTEDIDALISASNTVIFCPTRQDIQFDRHIVPLLKKAVSLSKNIIYQMPLDDNEAAVVQEICGSREYHFSEQSAVLKDIELIGRPCFFYSSKEEVSGDELPPQNRLYDIETPLVLVAGAGERSGKLDVQYALRDEFQKLGYAVSQISSRWNDPVAGIHPFPGFMRSREFPEEEKVFKFNRFIKTIEEREEPEIIICGVPGGLKPLNEVFPNRFGILLFEVCRAISPDFSIFSMYYDTYDPGFFDELKKELLYSLGIRDVVFNISPCKANWDNMGYENQLNFLTLDYSFVTRQMEKVGVQGVSAFNCLDKRNAYQLANYIIEELSQFADVEAF